MRRCAPDPRVAICLALALCQACRGSPVPPRLSAIEAQIFAPNCTFSSCHSSDGRAGNLILVRGKSFGELVDHFCDSNQARLDGMMRVNPGDPAHSFLVMKLQPSLDPKYGDPMPQHSPPLDESDRGSIEEWIREGAQNN